MKILLAALVLLPSIELGNIIAYSIAIGPTYPIYYYKYLQAYHIRSLNR